MIEGNTVLAVITARANSRGVEGKNYRSFCGWPLFEWSVEAALESMYVDFVRISTNCPHVIEAACNKWDDVRFYRNSQKRLGLILRPDELATPTSKNEDALLHAVDQVEQDCGFKAQIVVNLQPTSPIRRIGQIDFCLEAMISSGKSSLMTVSKHTPFFVKMTEWGTVEWLYDPKNRPMRQDLQDHQFFWHDDGCIYIMTTELLRRTHCRLSENPCLFENDPFCSMQIDSEDDFKILEAIKNVVAIKGLYI